MKFVIFDIIFCVIYYLYTDMENINIRLAKREEMKDVREMIQELADFENMPEGPQISAEKLMEDGYGMKPLFRCFVAELTSNGNPGSGILICYALIFQSYSTWEGRSMFLEDIYVKPEYRKRGVARKMFMHLVKLALSEGCARLDLHVLNWNPARSFYEKLGYNNLTETEGWLFYRLNSETMAGL